METITAPKNQRRVHKDESPKEVKLAGNGETDPETVLIFARKLKMQARVVKKAQKSYTLIKRLAKNAGLHIKELLEAIENQEMDPDKVAQSFARRKFYAEALDTPIGGQLSLFEFKPASTIPNAEERAAAVKKRGYVDGVMGANQDLQAYPPGHEEHQAYVEGYYDGQKVWYDKIKPIDEQLAEAEKVPTTATEDSEQKPETAEA